MPISVLIAAADDAFREAVKALLGATARRVIEATDGEEAVRLARMVRPDVVLMDIEMPGRDGLDATREIKSERPETKVILLASRGEEAYLSWTGKSGADDVVPRGRVRSELLPALAGILGTARS